MIRTELQLKDQAWVDFVGPTKDDLSALSKETGIPLRPLMNCLDPEHLPKYEVLEGTDTTFVILRVIDSAFKNQADSIEKLTTKIALFLTPKGLYTIHRLDPDFLKVLRQKGQDSPGTLSCSEFLRQLFTGSVLSYDLPLTQIEKKIDDFETSIVQGKRTGRLLKEGYLLRRKVSAFRKVLKFTIDVIGKVATRPEYAWQDIQDSRETADRLLFYTDEAFENINSLLSLHVALASQKTNEASYRTNETMRVLTVFSIFFLPLNFIAGIYGMNFEHMPELKWHYGYYATLGTMFAVALLIFVWMLRRGWLRSTDE